MRGWGGSSGGANRFLSIPPGGERRVVALADEPFIYVGHWWQGSMRPCAGEDCRMCGLGVGRQMRYVLEVVEVGTWRLWVWEFTAGTARRITEAVGLDKVAGLGFRVRRAGHAKGQMEVEYDPEGEAEAVARYGPGEGWIEELRGEIRAEEVLASWWASQGWESVFSTEFSPSRP